MSLFSLVGFESADVCEFGEVPDPCCCDEGELSAVSGTAAATLSSGVGTRFVGPAEVELAAAADAAADFQVSEAVVSLDCAKAIAPANTISSIAASDTPKR